MSIALKKMLFTVCWIMNYVEREIIEFSQIELTHACIALNTHLDMLVLHMVVIRRGVTASIKGQLN